jgi:hypothetical protein
MAYELFADSFDTQSTPSDARWTYSPTYTVIEAAQGRHGSAALRLWPSSVNAAWAKTIELTPSTHFVLGFSLKLPGVLYEAFSVGLNNASTGLAWLSITTTGRITCTLGGTTYQSAKTLAASSTNYLEIGIVVGDSGSLEVKVNGDSDGWLNLSGVDTKPGAISEGTNMQFYIAGSNPNAPYYVDDLTLTYGNELKWLGDVRVDALPLTANATPQDWTPDSGNAWERLNADAGYIESDTADDESRFDLADFTGVTSGIKAVIVNASAKKTDAGSRTFAIEVDSGGTVATGSTRSLGDSTQEYREVFLTDPDTGIAWTDSGIDALKVGVKVVA